LAFDAQNIEPDRKYRRSHSQTQAGENNMSIQAIKGDTVPVSHLPFSPAIKANGFLFVSGQASVDDSGKIVSDTFDNELRRSFQNLRRILHAAGLDFQHVVQVRSYVKNQSDLARYNDLYREYFKEPFPARTTIVNCLGTVLFEIDVVAAYPSKGTV
jgi:2-iminobutanoate/2-iminopropanoate deaminase